MFLPLGGESFACLDSFHAPDLSVHPALSRLQLVSILCSVGFSPCPDLPSVCIFQDMSDPPFLGFFPLHSLGCELLHTDSWYVSECFVASGLPTVQIWDRVNAGCHSWNPLTFLSSLCVPLMED